MANTPAIPPPPARALQVYAYDPSLGSYRGNRTTIHVPWEELEPGPAGRKIAVVDYDGANERYYPPVDLSDPMLLARDGLDPSESDPRFHQQMVYAVASRTIQMFEAALGRDLHWRRAERDLPPGMEPWQKTGDIWVLHLFPHAMHEANAYYSPDAHGIVFGYFSADLTNPGPNLPGQRVFTCLSHDIIAHEVTHAVIDGIRTHFTEPTNPDVLAFHEGFADLCALFSHFSIEDALVDPIRRTGGRLYRTDLDPVGRDDDVTADAARRGPITANLSDTNPLIQLALQFGQARGGPAGLRDAIGQEPDPTALDRDDGDPHHRGSILVSAVFDAYFSVYLRRAEDLFAIYRAGGGERDDDLPGPLARRLAATASRTADFFFTLCARALDYCPPVDVTFGDFLRALITVAKDVQPDDREGVPDALMDAFRRRGIYPDGVGFFSEGALAWPRREDDLHVEEVPIRDPDQRRAPKKTKGEPPKTILSSLVFGGPTGLTRRQKDINGDVLRVWVDRHRKDLGLHPTLAIQVPSFHTVYRVQDDGRTRVEMVVEILQSEAMPVEDGFPSFGDLPFRSGATLVIDGPTIGRVGDGPSVELAPRVRHVIAKPHDGDDGRRRRDEQRAFAVTQGFAFRSEHGYHADFGLLHEGR